MLLSDWHCTEHAYNYSSAQRVHMVPIYVVVALM